MSVSANNKLDAGSQPEEELASEAAARKVLLVEEQAHVVRVIRHNLERCGFQVDSADTTNGAMQLMMTCTYEALILTGERPAMHIRELCQRGSELLAVPVQALDPLMLVSCSEEDDLSDVLPGFERLGQPVSLKRIVERLREALDVPDPDLPA